MGQMVTLEVSQLDKSCVNRVSLANMPFMLVTKAVEVKFTVLAKLVAPLNMRSILVT